MTPKQNKNLIAQYMKDTQSLAARYLPNDSQNNFQRFQTFAASESTRNKTALLLCGVCRGEHDADCSFKMLKLVPPFRPSHRTANDVASSDDNADDDDAYAYGSVVDFEMDVEALVPQHVAPARVDGEREIHGPLGCRWWRERWWR